MKKVRTSPYHPQCDGLVERLNRSLIDILAKYCSQCPREWDLWLQVAVGAYRTAPQASIGLSPAELLYGRIPRSPVDIQFDTPLPSPMDPTSYVEQLKQRHREAKEVVEENLAAAQERQKRNFDPNHGTSSFKPGDMVYLSNPAVSNGQSRKLRNLFEGPYRVKATKGDVNYLIQPCHGGRHRCVHRDRLRPCYRRNSSNTDDRQTSLESGTTESPPDTARREGSTGSKTDAILPHIRSD